MIKSLVQSVHKHTLSIPPTSVSVQPGDFSSFVHHSLWIQINLLYTIFNEILNNIFIIIQYSNYIQHILRSNEEELKSVKNKLWVELQKIWGFDGSFTDLEKTIRGWFKMCGSAGPFWQGYFIIRAVQRGTGGMISAHYRTRLFLKTLMTSYMRTCREFSWRKLDFLIKNLKGHPSLFLTCHH